VCLNVGRACSFSPCAITTVASRSSTCPGSTRPAAIAGGKAEPVVSARCAHTTSRAAARAAASADRSVSESRSSSRHTVESDAVTPNRPG
jgi:hypothetical protein